MLGNRVRTVALLVVGTFVTLLGNGLHASVQVNHVDNLKSALTRVAIFPAACPPNVDCGNLESAIAVQLAERKVAVIPTVLIRQVMFDLQLEEVTDDLRHEVIKRFGVNAFLITVVSDTRRESTGSVGSGTGMATNSTKNPYLTSLWTMFGSANIERSSGNVHIAIIRADDGKILMRGTGYSESQLKGLSGVVNGIVSDIFERAFFVSVDR